MLPLGEIFLAAVEVYHNNWIKETLIVGILHEKYKMRYPPQSRIHISPIALTQNRLYIQIQSYTILCSLVTLRGLYIPLVQCVEIDCFVSCIGVFGV